MEWTVKPWTDDRVWNAVDAWRWTPPSSKRVTTPRFEIAVTPGSYALTYAYGLHTAPGSPPDDTLADLRRSVTALGGTGVRVQVLGRPGAEGLGAALAGAGYRVVEEAEALAWELLDELDQPRFPEFRRVDAVEVREVLSLPEYEGFLSLSHPIFGDPEPSEQTLAAFRTAFEKMVRETGHSDRYVAWMGELPIGRAGMEIAEDVARLWGTGVLPSYRRHGVYGMLVRARCEDALNRGAKLALVTARTGTSGPILRHHGFRSVGNLQIYEARWGPGIQDSTPSSEAPRTGHPVRAPS